MSMIVRDARESDLPIIVKFNCRLADETESKKLDQTVVTQGVRSFLADRIKGFYLVAESEAGEVIGQAAITYEWTDWRNGWLWWIQSVYVRADWRGRGVFRSLYQAFKQRAMDDPSVVGIRLYVENENRAAQRVYEAVGMRSAGYHVFEEMLRV